MYQRYAIYVTPGPESDLAHFGAAWLGWDSATGTEVAHPSEPDLDIHALTERPRKYGFHGTIKPPFHLAEGAEYAALERAFNALCADLSPVALDGLTLSRLGRFLALTPEGPTEALAELAARVVQDLDPFRAAPGPEELSRRRARKLSPLQEKNLTDWGYPYVLDAFRFHMTLTGPVAEDVGAMALERLSERVAALALAPFRIDALTLLGSDATGRFHQLQRAPLAGAA